MNGAKKFHSPDGPAFNAGEVWTAADGRSPSVEIVRTERYGVDKWDVDVFYWHPLDARRSVLFNKNAWAFQVRYQHQADKEI